MSTTSSLCSFVYRLANASVVEGDSDEERLRKETLTMVVVIIVPLATFWTVTYLLLDQ